MLQILIKRLNRNGLKFKLISIFTCLIILPVFAQIVYSQDSELEKSVYKPKPQSSKKATSNRSKKSSNKKSNSKKTSPASKKRSVKRPVKKTTRKRNRNVLVTFMTSSPQQEIWYGDKKLGITNGESQLEKWMKRGKYLLSVKNNDGDLIVKPKLVDISSKNTKFALLEEKPVEKPKPKVKTVEEKIDTDLKESIEAADKVKDILARYIDPLKTGTVSQSDWEYVSKMVKANKLNNFTKIQIEAQSWFSSGQIEFAKGNYKNAYVAFKKSANIIPDSAYPHYALGNAYFANREIANATNAFKKTIQLDPGFALAHQKLGEIYSISGKNKEAIISYKLAIQNGFNTPDVRFDLAKIYIKEKRREEASKELESVAEEAPSADVYISLGDLYTDLKREISAYEAYQKATKLSPTSAIAFFKLGDILYSAREYQRSKKAFEQAMSLDKKGRKINILLARKFIRDAANKLK